jgi:hypothetical protein
VIGNLGMAKFPYSNAEHPDEKNLIAWRNKIYQAPARVYFKHLDNKVQ